MRQENISPKHKIDMTDLTTPKFGPSGNSESFLLEGYTATMQMPQWLSKRGLELFEYSFGRGVNINKTTAVALGEECHKYGIELSVHAPYFINFASPEPDKAQNSIMYLVSSLKVLRHFGGERAVFHIGAESGQIRTEAFSRARDTFIQALSVISEEGLGDFIVCPETMGKTAQIGTIDEVVEFCNLGKNVYPCLDFGHINALYQGSLKTQDDFQRIVDRLFDGIGEQKTKNMHIHFSKIQYGAKGEIRHLTFEDELYGPRFEDFAPVIVKNGLTPHILSESAGTQAEDAVQMKSIYFSNLN